MILCFGAFHPISSYYSQNGCKTVALFYNTVCSFNIWSDQILRITDRQAKALASGKTYTEKVGGRGAGVLLLIGREKSVTAYYRYTAPDKSRPWLELGTLGREIGLAAARNRCAELALLRKTHPDLKSWLESQKIKEQERLIKEEQERHIEQSRATFKDLLYDYLASMAAFKQVSERTVRNIFINEVIEAWPAMVEEKARDIRPADISRVLKRISDRNALVYRNRVRSYLHSAFEFALKHEYDETRESGRVYGLEQNPVTPIPIFRHAEKPRERALSDKELRQLYQKLHLANSVSLQMANFVRFLIIIGGQRPQQVLRAPWSDYDLEQKTLLIRDLKGKRRDTKGTAHLIPLPAEAVELLNSLAPITGKYEWPFTTYGRVPFSLGALKNVFKRFLDSEFAIVDDKPILHFTAKDIRRTCKQVMTRAGIRRDLRNLLQNHGQTGVDVTNYANDPAAFLPEKSEAMSQYSEALKDVLKSVA
ncbi:tyrosine-type recombinase/integrase [Teredinibacter haidensis]|uniref:tyrosine-type recombinase/integrase n=1 Tax=Teredinibacter haidensis TaxID=2731755 RepID=UPI0011152BDB|nr:tyrosine-type recombinase/integrase [Teredinibacter haidensis]